MTWHAFDGEQKDINLGDVRVSGNDGLVIHIFDAKKPGDLVFSDCRSYRVSYESDLRKIIPSEVPSEISITQESQYIDWFRKNLEEDVSYSHLYHTLIFDLAVIVEVISESPPVFRANNS